MSDLERWLRPDETVIWSDRQRPRLLGWPPRSPLGLLLFALLGSAAIITIGVGAVAWRNATGVGIAIGPALVVGLAILVVCVLGVGCILAVVALLDPGEQYALVRDAEGRLVGLAFGPRITTRFSVEREPAVSGTERGHVDWGELTTEVLAQGERKKEQWVRWTDVAYPHVVAELVAEHLRARPSA